MSKPIRFAYDGRDSNGVEDTQKILMDFIKKYLDDPNTPLHDVISIMTEKENTETSTD